jgi:hypothetical protein
MASDTGGPAAWAGVSALLAAALVLFMVRLPPVAVMPVMSLLLLASAIVTACFARFDKGRDDSNASYRNISGLLVVLWACTAVLSNVDALVQYLASGRAASDF